PYNVPTKLGQMEPLEAPGVSMCLISAPPTAEILAQHWATELQEAFEEDNHREFKLVKLVVYETPNCMVEYIL
ncbi:hypothetical protein LCGC14_3163240, partial [marine sediment metagenome]